MRCLLSRIVPYLMFTIIFSCQEAEKKQDSIVVEQKTKPITKPKEIERPDTCDVIFSEFKYPEDVVNMSKTALQVQGQYIFATLSESSEYQLQSILSR